MDVLEFYKIADRICRTEERDCKCCPIYMVCNVAFQEIPEEDVVSTIDEIKKWKKAHAETRQSKFLKIYPNAIMDVNGIVSIDPCILNSSLQDTCDGELCPNCRKKYWNEEVLDGNSSNA